MAHTSFKPWRITAQSAAGQITVSHMHGRTRVVVHARTRIAADVHSQLPYSPPEPMQRPSSRR